MEQPLKNDLRASLLLKRRALSSKVRRKKSILISKRLQNSNLFQTAQYIHFYLSNQEEVESTFLIQESLRLKKQVAVPVISSKKTMSFSELHTLDANSLEYGPFGIRQPTPALQKRIAADKIDLWIIPGVSFDIMGGRLGYGGGYYDRALAQTHASIVALAFDIQVVGPLPLDRRDVPVDWIFTETRTIYCEENRLGRKTH